MLKSLALVVVLASVIASITSAPASARTTAAQCQAIYEKAQSDPQSYRANRDDYIRCIGQL